MMKNKKSGWSGKVKVALTIALTLLFSVIIVQCNSKIEEQVSLDSEAAVDFTNGVNLPVLPKSRYTFNGNLNDVLNISIAGDKLTIEGKMYELEQIGSVIEKSELSKQGAVILRVASDQKMSLVREVSTVLRKTDRLKILHLAQTNAGERLDMAIMLSPLPGSAKGAVLPKIDEEYVQEHGLDLFKVDAGDAQGASLQDQVYGLVMDHVKNGTSTYVVSLKYDNEDTYGDYLTSLAYIQAGFDQIYQERALEMFGKDFYALKKEDYMAVRKGIPKAISIAE